MHDEHASILLPGPTMRRLWLQATESAPLAMAFACAICRLALGRSSWIAAQLSFAGLFSYFLHAPPRGGQMPEMGDAKEGSISRPSGSGMGTVV